MKSFAREFLRDHFTAVEPQIFLGAFGKHPGWDDHMDDLGLETESLVEAKQRLYVEGIGAQIGAWEKMDRFTQIDFNHLFLWRRGPQVILGRLWASTDGKKRGRYPMVVCVHCAGAPLPLILDPVLDAFEELRDRVMATSSAEEVRNTAGEFRQAIREWLATADAETALPATEGAEFLQDIDLATEQAGLVKTLYLVRESAFGAGRYAERSVAAPAHFRMLASTASAVRSIYFWDRVLETQLDPAVPLLLLVPCEQYWMDAIVGLPAPADLFCLRASPRAVGLSCEGAPEPPVAYSDSARAMLQQVAAGEPLLPPDAGTRSWIGRIFGSHPPK
jgi:hypothetical protein